MSAPDFTLPTGAIIPPGMTTDRKPPPVVARNVTALLTTEQATKLLTNYPCCILYNKDELQPDGKRSKGKNPKGAAWQKKPVKSWDGKRGIGVICGALEGFNTPVYGFDADIVSTAAAAAFATIVERYIPNAPKRIGLAPKSLIPFTLADGAPLAKSEFTTKAFFPDGNADLESEKCQLEVLGSGNQFVAYHVHPDTQKPYYWLNSELYDLAPDQLPVLTRSQLSELKAAFEQVMQDHNLAVKTIGKTAPTAAAAAVAHPRQGANGYVSDAGYVLHEVLQFVPNDDRDDWQVALAAIHAATGGNGVNEAYTWSSNSTNFEDAGFWRTWNSFGNYSGKNADWGKLIAIAKQNGMPSKQVERATEVLNTEIDIALGTDQPAEKQSSLKRIDLLDVMTAELEEVSFSVDKIFPKRHVTLFGGHGGMGKSMLALTMAAHVAAGVPFAGLPVTQSVVLFASLEDEASVVKVRLRKIIQHYNLPTNAVLTNLRLLDGTGAESALMTQSTEFNGKPEMTKAFVELAHASEDAGLIMIDNASDAYDGSENVRKEVRFFIRNLARMARARNASVVLLAHIDKAAQRNGTAGDDYSGSTAWHNSVRSRVALKQDPNHSDHSGAPALLVLEHQKANLSSKANPLTLEFIDGGLIVPVAGNASDAGIDRSTWDVIEMMRCIKLATEQYLIDVPTRYTAGNGSAMQALEPIKEYPSAFKGTAGRRRASSAILEAKSRGWIIEEAYITDSRNKRSKFIVSSTYAEPINQPEV